MGLVPNIRSKIYFSFYILFLNNGKSVILVLSFKGKNGIRKTLDPQTCIFFLKKNYVTDTMVLMCVISVIFF
jgi:hypothetical protein